jgi:uncharacterized membrane protein
MFDKLAKYGEGMLWLVLASMFPVIAIWNGNHMPKGSILYWGIPALIISTIGFFLNRRQIELDSAKWRKEFDEMNARHEKMLAPFKDKRR